MIASSHQAGKLCQTEMGSIEPLLYETQTQVLGLTPTSFIDRLVEAWTRLFYDTETALRHLLEEQLLSTEDRKASGAAKETSGCDRRVEEIIDEGMQKWATRFEQGFDRGIDRWETYMHRNMLKIDDSIPPLPVPLFWITSFDVQASID